jgi:hypothetical protein
LGVVLVAALGAGPAQALEKVTSLVTGKPIGELAVAGRLAVDLHAEFMVTRTLEKDTVLNWYNCGYSGGGRGTKVGGNFGDFGFQVPWQQRDEKYPHAVTIDKVRAVRFNGGQALKGNFEVEPKHAGAQGMALEVWLRAAQPARGEIILGWQSRDGKETSGALAFPEKFQGSDQWRHLVVNCTPGQEDCYLDGVKVSSGKRALLIKAGHLMVLGGASAERPSFKGELAAVRLHDGTLTAEQLAHNFQGGVMLGTELHNWWRTELDKWLVVESEHFRHAVDKAEVAKWTAQQRKEFDERVPGMFRLAELVYHSYSERLGLRSSVVSRRPEKRGDGIKYKTPIQPTDGGNFMGCNDDFGWACQGPGFINPHELVHGWDVMTGGMAGNYWEAHANWPQTFNGIYQTMPPGCVSIVCSCCPANGRDYYHDRLMFDHLAQTPDYGPLFIAKLWFDGPTTTEGSPYPWIAFSQINPYPERTLAQEFTRMVMRNVTWDYTTFAEAAAGQGNTPQGNFGVPSAENLFRKDARENKADIQRFARIILERVPYAADWWRVPKEQAPQQLGWNICPLKFQSGAVTATLAGYTNPKRGGDWRAAFVSVDATGKPTYGDIFSPGKAQSFTVKPDAKELFLVVCATPTNLLPINMVGDFRSFEQEPFPYAVKLGGCEPLDAMAPEKSAERGTRHANGGGFVAAGAKVAATAFVGPKARVLGSANITGRARIEDYAVVNDATVGDDAVVSGHASVSERAQVRGRAKVRDYAVVKARSSVQGNARILEHATLASQKTCGDDVTVKGLANVYGGNQSGTTLVDGFYAKGNELTKGKWFTWSWGQGKNPGEVDEDFGGLYADYDFEQEHAWMARDAFGATWGYLIGAPKFALDEQRAKRVSTLLKPEAVLPRMEVEAGGGSYVLQLAAFLSPPVTGDYTFFVQGDDEATLWLGAAGATHADRELCSNPFFAEYRNFQKFPAQKSAAVHLERGRLYPLNALVANHHSVGSLSVAWTKPGGKQPVVIGKENLSVTPDGRKPGVRQRSWGGVSKIPELLKRPDYPEGVQRTGGQALVLDGRGQFVELPKDVADLQRCTYTAEFKASGAVNGARLYEFANPNGDAVWMSPNENGRLVFGIRRGAKVEQVSTVAAAAGVWTSVQISLDGPRATLSVNGRQVAENKAMTLAPESVRATQCYLGRGLKGGYFGGQLDRFTIHCLPLAVPNAAKP